MEYLHNNSKQKAVTAGVTNIEFLLGDSSELLKQIMPKVLDGSVFSWMLTLLVLIVDGMGLNVFHC